jgi:hypothetical protein
MLAFVFAQTCPGLSPKCSSVKYTNDRNIDAQLLTFSHTRICAKMLKIAMLMAKIGCSHKSREVWQRAASLENVRQILQTFILGAWPLMVIYKVKQRLVQM